MARGVRGLFIARVIYGDDNDDDDDKGCKKDTMMCGWLE